MVSEAVKNEDKATKSLNETNEIPDNHNIGSSLIEIQPVKEKIDQIAYNFETKLILLLVTALVSFSSIIIIAIRYVTRNGKLDLKFNLDRSYFWRIIPTDGNIQRKYCDDNARKRELRSFENPKKESEKKVKFRFEKSLKKVFKILKKKSLKKVCIKFFEKNSNDLKTT